MTSGAFLKKVIWKHQGISQELFDVMKISINKSTEIKNNLCNLSLRNAPTTQSGVGTYVNQDNLTVVFNEEDEFSVWSKYTNDPSDVTDGIDSDTNLLGNFILEGFQLNTSENNARIGIKAIDTAFHLFNKVFTFSYGVGNQFTSPGIIRHICRHHTESNLSNQTTHLGTQHDIGTSYVLNSKFVSEGGYIDDYRRIRTSTDPDVYSVDQETTLNGAITSSDTTITVVSTTGFESDGTIVIDSEHISYTGVTATTFTGCTRGIDDTKPVSHTDTTATYKGFPLIIINKFWKPLFEWMGEIAQTENTNYLSEVQQGNEKYYKRAFLFWIDKNNAPHYMYPDNVVDQTIELGEEGTRAFKLEKSVFDSINFIVYNCGEDMYGEGCSYFWYDPTSEVASLKMRGQPMVNIIINLIAEDRKLNTSRDTTNQDIYKQFPSSYTTPIIPSFLGLANQFRVGQLGLTERTNVNSDTEYNNTLREAAKQIGLSKAQKITTKRTGLRYKGQISVKGTHLQPGDLVTVTNSFVGVSEKNLRVLSLTHSITNNGWATLLNVEEDIKEM